MWFTGFEKSRGLPKTIVWSAKNIQQRMKTTPNSRPQELVLQKSSQKLSESQAFRHSMSWSSSLADANYPACEFAERANLQPGGWATWEDLVFEVGLLDLCDWMILGPKHPSKPIGIAKNRPQVRAFVRGRLRRGSGRRRTWRWGFPLGSTRGAEKPWTSHLARLVGENLVNLVFSGV